MCALRWASHLIGVDVQGIHPSLWWTTPNRGVGGQCITTIISGAAPHRHVYVLCLVTIISMGFNSYGSHVYRSETMGGPSGPKMATQGATDSIPAFCCGIRRWPPIRFKCDHPFSLGCGPKLSSRARYTCLGHTMCFCQFLGGDVKLLQKVHFFDEITFLSFCNGYQPESGILSSVVLGPLYRDHFFKISEIEAL